MFYFSLEPESMFSREEFREKFATKFFKSDFARFYPHFCLENSHTLKIG